MGEPYILHFLGGELDTEMAIVDDVQEPWPARGIIKGNLPGGHYVKVSEDERPVVPGGTPIRIATYNWQRQ